MTNYIYLLHGPCEGCFAEAAYSIGTLMRWLDANSSRIIVFTDQPERVKDWPVISESLVGQLESMYGKNGYTHRAKSCVILKCFEKYPGNMMFLDSDTFVRGDIVKLADQLSPETAIMHAFESRNPEIGLSGFRAKLAGEITYRFTPDSRMYNSGVIGLHRDHRRVASLALHLCDAILDFATPIRTPQQFSLGEVLRISNIKILEARDVVVHYNGKKFYVHKKISEMARETGQPPWAFKRQIPYSPLKVYLLKKALIKRQRWMRKLERWFGFKFNPDHYRELR